MAIAHGTPALGQVAQQGDRAGQRADPGGVADVTPSRCPACRRSTPLRGRAAAPVSPQQRPGEQAAAHADLAVDAPHGDVDALGLERLAPGEHVLVDAVDERAVEVEQHAGAADRVWGWSCAPACPRSQPPSAECPLPNTRFRIYGPEHARTLPIQPAGAGGADLPVREADAPLRDGADACAPGPSTRASSSTTARSTAWSRASRSAGSIRARETTREGRRPQRTVYEITDDGEVELNEWMAEMVSVPGQGVPALRGRPVLPPRPPARRGARAPAAEVRGARDR